MTEKEIQYAIFNAKARKELTWKEIEAQTGWAPSVMRRWFGGLTTPRLPALLDMLDALGLELVVREKEKPHEDTDDQCRREPALY